MIDEKEPSMDYDKFTADLARYPKEQNDPAIIEAMYCALGLVGEAGEVSEKIKKWHRDGNLDKESVVLELGDVLYYLTRLANAMGATLGDVQNKNVQKLTSRAARGVLKGSGDDR